MRKENRRVAWSHLPYSAEDAQIRVQQPTTIGFLTLVGYPTNVERRESLVAELILRVY